jgi:hypothetical protein
MKPKYSVFSTQNKKYYDLIGKESIRTFLENWPFDITFTLYAEDFHPDIVNPRLIVKDFSDIQQGLDNYLATHNRTRDEEMYKFWIKSFAWLQGAKDIGCEYLIWLDSDIISDRMVDYPWLDSIIDRDALITDIPSGDWLRDKESETGFAVLNFNNPYALEFIRLYKDHFDSNTITQLHRHIDSAVWWNTVKMLQDKTKINHLHTTEDHWGPFKYTVLASRLTHWIAAKNKRAWAKGKARVV